MKQPKQGTPRPDEALLRNLLERVARQELSVDEALPQVQLLTGSVASTIQNATMQRQKATASWIVGGVFAAIGTVFLCVGLGISWQSLQFLDAPKADGVIIAMGNGVPTAKYKVKNVEYQVKGTVSSKPPAFSVGDKVTVLYKADDPADAHIDSFVERWLFLIIFGGLGAVFAAIGWLTLISKLVAYIFRPWPAAIDESERFKFE